MTEDFMKMFHNRKIFKIKHDGTTLSNEDIAENSFYAVLEINTLSKCQFLRVHLTKNISKDGKTYLYLDKNYYVGSLFTQSEAFF